MKTDSTIEALRRIHGLEGCSDKTLKKLVPLVDRATVTAGYQLTKQGSYGREAFVILSGRAAVEIDGVVVGESVAGDIVGEMALIEGGSRTATVTALTEMTLLVISQASFGAFMHNEDVAVAMVGQLSHRLREADSRP